jgi:S-adenosylmethionine synthetase
MTDDSVLDRLAVEDQANVFGFACTHTPSLMPLPIQLAHELARRLDDARTSGLDYLSPDGKTQVGIEFRGLRPHRVHSITLVAAQEASGVPSFASFQQDLLETVVRPTFVEHAIRPDNQTRIAINPEGPIVGGGPELHAGLTGRKTAVDTYGEFARHSGAALSGKDPLRIDRVGAYAARYAAKNVVAAGLADQCEVQLTYAIGIAEPVSVNVETYGTERVEENEIARRLRSVFDFRLGAIVRELGLRRQAHEDPDFFRRLAAYGHFGRSELLLPWERTDRVDALCA